MVDKTEDFVLLERPELDVVTTREQSSVVITEPESSVVTVEETEAVTHEVTESVVIAAGQIGPRGADGAQGASGSIQVISALNATGQTLRRGTVVTQLGDGSIVKANATTSPRVIGLVETESLPPATYGTVQVGGLFTASQDDWVDVVGGAGGIVTGNIYYLSITPGQITTTPSLVDTVSLVGKAVSTTQFMLSLERPVFP